VLGYLSPSIFSLCSLLTTADLFPDEIPLPQVFHITLAIEQEGQSPSLAINRYKEIVRSLGHKRLAVGNAQLV
jgi:hypothetical protein